MLASEHASWHAVFWSILQDSHHIPRLGSRLGFFVEAYALTPPRRVYSMNEVIIAAAAALYFVTGVHIAAVFPISV